MLIVRSLIRNSHELLEPGNHKAQGVGNGERQKARSGEDKKKEDQVE
jgi:hypothetical protein